MMSKTLKSVALLICASLVITTFAGCTSKSKEPVETKENIKISDKMNMTGMPIVKEPVTLKIMVGKNAAQTNWDKMLVWREYEKLSGVHVEWIEVIQNSIIEKRNLAIASGDLPDIFFKCNIPTKDLQSNGEQGIFVKLNDLINKFAPNFKKAITERNDVEKGIKTVDGSIYSLPYIMDVLSPAITGKTFMNKKWLDKLGMKVPSTTDEFYNILSAIKKNDLNGNGKNDEIPFTGPTFKMIMSTVRGAWGLGK